MTIHQSIARDLLATGANDLQDAYRIAWMKSIPPTLRKAGSHGATDHHKHIGAAGSATIAANAAARRVKLAKAVLPLHRAGHGTPEIHRRTGISPNSIRRILREAGLTPNKGGTYDRTKRDYSLLLKEAHAMRADGLTWAEIGQRLRVSKQRIREAYNEWRAQA